MEDRVTQKQQLIALSVIETDVNVGKLRIDSSEALVTVKGGKDCDVAPVCNMKHSCICNSSSSSSGGGGDSHDVFLHSSGAATILGESVLAPSALMGTLEMRSPESTLSTHRHFDGKEQRVSSSSAQTYPTGSASARFPDCRTVEYHSDEKVGHTGQAVSMPSLLSAEEKVINAWSPKPSRVDKATGCSNSSAACPQRRPRLLQPLALIQDPSAASAVREQNRSTLIAELERRKRSLQLQLVQMRKELSSQNIFSLVWASKASELQHLLEKGICDVNRRDYNGCTPLHLAAMGGNIVIVRVLITFGADVMVIDNTGRTPLDWAAANRHSGVFRYLMNVTQGRIFKHQHQQRNVTELTVSFEKDTGVQNSSSLKTTEESTPFKATSMCFLHTKDLSCRSCASLVEVEGGAEQGSNVTSSSALDCVTQKIVSSMSPQCGAVDSSTDESVLHDEEDIEAEYMSMKYSSYSTFSDTVSLVVCMVGLPGRGKSYIAHRVSRYLNWKGVPCRVFNAGNYRRQLIGLENTVGPGFYDPNNVVGKKMRDMMADIACDALMKFISQHRIAVGMFDATNTTKARRKHLLEVFTRMANQFKVKCGIIFIESICTDDNVITENILRSKCGNDDYKNVTDTSEVIVSFCSRIAQYEKVYEPLDTSEDLSFIRIVNAKSHVVLHKIPCGIASRIAFFLLNLHPVAYPIYIALPGETEGERSHVYGGSERLTPLGEKFAEEVKRFILKRLVQHMIVLHGTNASVLNTLKPLVQTLRGDSSIKNCKDEEVANIILSGITSQEELLCSLPGLDSINYGCFSGKTADWARRKYASLSRLLYVASPQGSVESELDFFSSKMGSPNNMNEGNTKGDQQQQQKRNDALRTRYFDKGAQAIRRFRYIPNGTDPRLSYRVQFPHGESCQQVNVRLEPVLMAVMRMQGPVFVLATSVPAQGVLAYFTDVMPELSPTLRLPRNAVVEIGVKGDITVHQLVESREDIVGFDLK